MRFGLDRMRRMMTALGSPQRRFDTIHVLGTNGKSSTTRMIAAILERHGLRTGAYTSPHLVSYTERVQVAERDLDSDAFAAAVARAAWAAERVNRTLSEDDHVTQFELLTAAALWEMAERGVEVAVLEAGLGGRYDATSVIESRVTVLTNVGLEHTRWLGPTLKDIAEEKLAVAPAARRRSCSEPIWPAALEVAGRVAGERAARIVQVAAALERPLALLARGSFQQRNFALARAAAEAYLKDPAASRERSQLGCEGEAHERAVRDAAAATAVPRALAGRRGRAADGVRRRAQPACDSRRSSSRSRSLRRPAAGAGAGGARGQGRRRHARRAAGRVRARLVHRSPEQPRAVARRRCSRLRASSASRRSTASPRRGGRSPRRALGRGSAGARCWSTGSVYLVGDLLAACEPAIRLSGAAALECGLDEMNDEGPSVLTMIGAVALIVALVILVFFAAGYGFGRLFL